MASIPLSSLKNPLQTRWLLEPERLAFLRAFGEAAEAHQDPFCNSNRRTMERRHAEPRGAGRPRPGRIEGTFKGLLDFRQLLERAALTLPPKVAENGLLDMRGVRLGLAVGTVDGEPGYPALGKSYGLRGLLFEGIDFSEAWFDDAMLAFSVFRNCILDGASFSNASVCEFAGCRMTGADFDEARCGDLLFDDCHLQSCRLTRFRSALSAAFRSRFHQCDFRKGGMQSAFVEDCLFVDCNFARCPWGNSQVKHTQFENCYFEDPWGEPPPPGAVSTPNPPKLKRVSRKRTKAAPTPPSPPKGFNANSKGFWCLLFRPGTRTPEEVLSEALARPVAKVSEAEDAKELGLELNELGSGQPSRRFGLSEAKDVAALWTLPLEAPRWFDEALELSRRRSGPVVLSMAEDDEAGLIGFLAAEAGEVRRLHWELRIAESQTLDEGAALPSEAENPFKTWLGAKALGAAAKSLGYDLEALGRGPFRVVELTTAEGRGALWRKIEDAMTASPPPSKNLPEQPPPSGTAGPGLLAGIRRWFGR